MAQVCELTGKRPLVGNNVSNSNVKIKKRQIPNLHSKKFYIPELKKSVSLKLSSKAIRTIDKIGLTKAVLKQDVDVLSKTLKQVQRDLRK